MCLVTFIIPVRHPANARDWGLAKSNLAQTIASISNQTCGDWRAIVVADTAADLPALPAKFAVERVDFLPNHRHDRGGTSRAEFYDAFRIDKGRRVLKGMLRAGQARFFMVVDDDDLVSANIVKHVSENAESDGWIIRRGYVWNHGGNLLLAYDHFNVICGTCLIIRSDLYGLPHQFAAASPEWIKLMLGGHIGVTNALAERGATLATLPFRGAIYRVGHRGSHSRTPSVLIRFFLNFDALKRPRQMLLHASCLSFVDEAVKAEFFGRNHEREIGLLGRPVAETCRFGVRGAAEKSL